MTVIGGAEPCLRRRFWSLYIIIVCRTRKVEVCQVWKCANFIAYSVSEWRNLLLVVVAEAHKAERGKHVSCC